MAGNTSNKRLPNDVKKLFVLDAEIHALTVRAQAKAETFDKRIRAISAERDAVTKPLRDRVVALQDKADGIKSKLIESGAVKPGEKFNHHRRWATIQGGRTERVDPVKFIQYVRKSGAKSKDLAACLKGVKQSVVGALLKKHPGKVMTVDREPLKFVFGGRFVPQEE